VWWKDLKIVCGLGYDKKWFNNNIIWNLGKKKNQIKFWDDRWNDQIKLGEIFSQVMQ